jgi:biopolymer transport protein TolR
VATGRRHRSLQRKHVELDAVRNEINVTPLVDVMLVLLIIMMVIGPMLARGKEVPLPETRHHLEPNDNHEPIIAIDQYGKVWVDKDEIAPGPEQIATIQDMVQRQWQELRASNAKLGGEVDRTGEDRVLVKVSPDIPYGQVYPIIMALHDMHAGGIDLGTEELKE